MSSSIVRKLHSDRGPRLARLSATQFHQLIAHGILSEGEPVELIDGLLVRKDEGDVGGRPMIHGPRHALCLKKLQRVGFRDVDNDDCHLATQLPIALADDLEPEPDGAVVRGQPEHYADRHPAAGEVLAVVEISDSSLEYDRTTKQRVFAASGIPVYWIVNIADRRVEVHELPDEESGRYRKRTDFFHGEDVPLPAGPGRVVPIAVAELMP